MKVVYVDDTVVDFNRDALSGELMVEVDSTELIHGAVIRAYTMVGDVLTPISQEDFSALVLSVREAKQQLIREKAARLELLVEEKETQAWYHLEPQELRDLVDAQWAAATTDADKLALLKVIVKKLGVHILE